MSQPANPDPWEQIDPELLNEQGLEDLARLLDEAKREEQRQKSEGGRDESVSAAQMEIIESVSHAVIERLQKEYKKPPADLAKHLVALDKVEKGFASFLVARIEAMETRIAQLNRERARLERLVQQSSKSILGTLFTGVRSQLRLDGVTAELHTLTEEKKRIWEHKVHFNVARADRKVETKDLAKNILIERRDNSLLGLQDLVLTLLEQCVSKGETYFKEKKKTPHEFLAIGGHFGKFTSVLSQSLKVLIDKAGDPVSYIDHKVDYRTEMQRKIQAYMEGREGDSPNCYLSLAKVLAGKRQGSLIPESEAIHLLSWDQQEEKGKLNSLTKLIRGLPVETQARIGHVVMLFKRIERLNEIEAPAERLALVRLFRELIIRQAGLVQNLKKSAKVTAAQRRKLHESVHHALDRAVLFIADHWDEIR